MTVSKFRKDAIDIFNAALQAVDPYGLVKDYSDYISSAYQKGHFNKLFIVSFGKAAFAMTKALSENIPDIITKGILITKYGHVNGALADNISIFEAGHPVPDEKGSAATQSVIDMLKDADRQTLVVCLISGGGSALLAAPRKGITLNEKKLATELLLRAGADIHELNTVRKHISAIKGGKLAEIAYPAKVISLILSDVIGDSLDVIASGPTSPDKTTYRDAVDVLEKYGLTDKIPDHILNMLEKCSEEEKALNGQIEQERMADNIIIGSNKIATEAAKIMAMELGFKTTVTTSELQGDARAAAKWLADFAIKKTDIRYSKFEILKPVCLISGGETTVTVKGRGIGGRNMELALAFAVDIAGVEDITLLSAGTDGTDGPTDAAGAIVDGETIRNAKLKGLDPMAYLENNDSYTFFKKTGELLITGSTGTNVMDVQIILINE
jgi:glycerate-2-kinase